MELGPKRDFGRERVDDGLWLGLHAEDGAELAGQQPHLFASRKGSVQISLPSKPLRRVHMLTFELA